MAATTVTLRPNAQGTYNNFTAGGGWTKVTAVSDQVDGTYNVPLLGTDPETYLLADVSSPSGSLVSSVIVHLRANAAVDGSYSFRLRLNGTDKDSAAPLNFTGGGVNLQNVQETFLTKPGGGAWTIGDVNALEIGVTYLNWAVNVPQLVEMWAEVTYNPIPGELEHVRVIATHRLLMKRQARSLIQITGPAILGDVELLSLLPWSHRNGPSADGLGWGEKTWERRSSRLLSSVWDLNTMRVSLVAQDYRSLWTMLYDECRTLISSSAYANGVGRLYVGTRTYNRDSKAWVTDPSDGIVREVAYDIEQLCADIPQAGSSNGGQLLEEASTNELTRSSFVSGTTGITLGGTGVNGSAIAVDSTTTLFDTTITPNSLKFTAGSPHAAALTATWAATASILANTICRFSVDYKNDDATGVAEALYWRLVRNFDGFFWNNGSSTWVVGATDNALNKSFGTNSRGISSLIDVGASDTTLTLSVRQQTGGTALRSDHCYHVQLERKRWTTSRMVTDSATTTRAVSTLSYTNNTGARNFPATCGTMMFDYIPEGIDVNATTDSCYFLKLDYDANNWFRGFYDGSDGKIKFQVRVAGVTSTASQTLGFISRGSVTKVAFRWTSSEAELDLAAGTISVFVNGVKGTDAIPGAMPTETSPATIYLGCDGSNAAANGLLKRIFVTPVVMTNQEIARTVPAISGR